MKVARICFMIAATMFVLIGILHLSVHYRSLLSEDLATKLEYPFELLGNETNAWDLWQGFSFMMGVLLVAVGLFNFVAFRNIAKSEFPPVGNTLVTIFILCTVIYSGVQFFSSMQIYGGAFGLLLLIISLIFRFSNTKKT